VRAIQYFSEIPNTIEKAANVKKCKGLNLWQIS